MPGKRAPEGVYGLLVFYHGVFHTFLQTFAQIQYGVFYLSQRRRRGALVPV
jgi:hypothetical protein